MESEIAKVRTFIQTAKPSGSGSGSGNTKQEHQQQHHQQLQLHRRKSTAAAAAAETDAEMDTETETATATAITAKKPKVWHPQQEKLLKQWAEIATSFRWMHHHAHLRYAWMHFWFTLPVIVMSSITGTMNFAQGTFPTKYETYVPLLIGSINLIAGIITTVASYLRVSELSEGNRVASIMFGKLSRNIRVELLLPSTERTMDGADFISMCRSELDRLTEQTPDIPQKIEKRFVRQFEELLKTEFYPPELTDLHPVEIYTGEIERRQEVVANVLTSAALQFKQAQQQAQARAAAKTKAETEAAAAAAAAAAAVPVPVVMKPVAAPPSAGAMLAEEAKEQREQELSQLSNMQTVSSRLRNKATAARERERESRRVSVNGLAALAGGAAVPLPAPIPTIDDANADTDTADVLEQPPVAPPAVAAPAVAAPAVTAAAAAPAVPPPENAASAPAPAPAPAPALPDAAVNAATAAAVDAVPPSSTIDELFTVQ